MGTLIHRFKAHWGFRKAWRESMSAGIIEVSKLRQQHENPKEHKPTTTSSEVED